jgi:hypothetical protein
LELEDNYLKRTVSGQQNPTPVVVREGKCEKMKLIPAVNKKKPWTVKGRLSSGKQQAASSRPSFHRFTGDS